AGQNRHPTPRSSLAGAFFVDRPAVTCASRRAVGHIGPRSVPDPVVTQPAPPAPTSRSALAVLFGVVFINLVGFGIVIPLLPFYGLTLDAPPWQVALMFSAYSLGQFVA